MIDFNKLAHALLVAKSLGYQEVHVPWIIPGYVGDVTRPETAHRIHVRSVETFFNGELIASGETGLLAERYKYDKPDQLLVCCTPCFRSEPVYQHGLHEPWFMKVELMCANPTFPEVQLKCMKGIAKLIMQTWTRKLVDDPVSGDIMLNGIEVGSYGVRRFESFQWVYGTGIAEPRFSYALTQKK